MKKNLNKKGRLLRLFIAIVLFVLAYYRSSWQLFSAGMFVLFEAAFSWCIFFQLIGKNSCHIKRNRP
jgi:hypothetical protein